MHRIAWHRIIFSIGIAGSIVYLFIAFLFRNEEKEIICKTIAVKIKNKAISKLVTTDDIEYIINHSEKAGIGKPLNDNAIKELRKQFKDKSLVKNVLLYYTGDSTLYVELEQRVPVIRIITEEGSCYLDEAGYAFPPSLRYAYNVPLVTGAIQLPAKGTMLKDSVFVNKLLEFVNYISENSFWNAQIQQINIDVEKNVEFVVCSDNHLIRFGQLEGYEEKLDNLLVFYKKVNPYRTDSYKILDLRFNKQIVAIIN
jgi:cell division protein FtsQ